MPPQYHIPSFAAPTIFEGLAEVLIDPLNPFLLAQVAEEVPGPVVVADKSSSLAEEDRTSSSWHCFEVPVVVRGGPQGIEFAKSIFRRGVANERKLTTPNPKPKNPSPSSAESSVTHKSTIGDPPQVETQVPEDMRGSPTSSSSRTVPAYFNTSPTESVDCTLGPDTEGTSTRSSACILTGRHNTDGAHSSSSPPTPRDSHDREQQFPTPRSSPQISSTSQPSPEATRPVTIGEGSSAGAHQAARTPSALGQSRSHSAPPSINSVPQGQTRSISHRRGIPLMGGEPFWQAPGPSIDAPRGRDLTSRMSSTSSTLSDEPSTTSTGISAASVRPTSPWPRSSPRRSGGEQPSSASEVAPRPSQDQMSDGPCSASLAMPGVDEAEPTSSSSRPSASTSRTLSLDRYSSWPHTDPSPLGDAGEPGMPSQGSSLSAFGLDSSLNSTFKTPRNFRYSFELSTEASTVMHNSDSADADTSATQANFETSLRPLAGDDEDTGVTDEDDGLEQELAGVAGPSRRDIDDREQRNQSAPSEPRTGREYRRKRRSGVPVPSEHNEGQMSFVATSIILD
ncbi:hypothetical protein DXG01_001798 [Tephrocybe rancida]|nr:hypothetical protein DXG01_001798 [Tephrocybe rancida]